jgi:hypothetical protein
MAAKPTTIPTWATGTNYDAGSDPWSGTARKVAPSAGMRISGWTPDTEVGAQHLNYDQNLHGEWIAYLDDLHGSADFLNKSYTWVTGTHTFSAPLGGSLTVATGNITTTLGDIHSGDAITAVNDILAGGDLAAGKDITAGFDFLYQTPPARSRLVPLTSFVDANGTATRRWILSAKESALDASDNYNINVVGPSTYSAVAELVIPDGCTLTSISVSAHQSAAGSGGAGSATGAMTLYVLKSVIGSTGSPPTVTVLGSDFHDGTSGDLLVVTGLAEVANNDQHQYLVRIDSSDAGGAEVDTVYRVTMGFTDLGPRNF